MGGGALHEFLRGLPKCEHHVHLEGCLTPNLVFDLAARNSVSLPDLETNPAYASPEALKERYERFTSLDDFLSFYFIGMSVLLHQSDFEDLAWGYFRIAHADGVHHAEVSFDPQEHVNRGVSYDAIVSGFTAACKRAEKELGMTTKLILCFVKHLPIDDAYRLFNHALNRGDFESGVIHGIGCSSSEIGPPKDMFREIYASAGSVGLNLTAHAGEEGDPSYISTALDIYKTKRIDHGVTLVDDPKLMKRVAQEEILLTVCPLSNVKLRVFDDIKQAPIRKFLDWGVRFSINSDDPAYFGGYALHNYYAVQEAFGLSIDEWKTIAENSIRGSWIDDDRKAQLLQLVENHVAKYKSIG